MDSFDWAELGHTDLLPAGHQLAAPELLFEKIEDDVIQAQVDKLLATKKANEAAGYALRYVISGFQPYKIRVRPPCPRINLAHNPPEVNIFGQKQQTYFE